MAAFLLINGSDLNLLGSHEPDVYGGTYLDDIEASSKTIAAEIPLIELHLNNTFAREEFPHSSHCSDIAQSCLFGFGAYGYELALPVANQHMAAQEGQ
ncbi:MAG: type II 3-dehydroquinate dehydratase [Gammaproteobacteria bacterium]|nr:type II 3-dehydroquinate dehydratase [Gammaproteobacteria bacterium]